VIAVVLAAGRGTRLGGGVPKPLVSVGGVPVIDRILDGLAVDGFDDVVVVTGHEAERVRTHLAGRGVRFAKQAEPSGTAHALTAARELVGDRRFLLSWVDVIVPPGTYRRVVAGQADLDGAVAVNYLDDVSAGALVLAEGGMVIRLTEKPGRLAGDNLTGVLALGPAVWQYAGAVKRSERGEFELPDAINDWLEAGARIAAVPVAGPVFEVGTESGLGAADAYFSNADR
jgi:dTDP-glucose pyrophosphorylase